MVQMTPISNPHIGNSQRASHGHGGVSDRARRLFISMRGCRERAPPGRGRWASVWRGGLGSATSRGIDRIKLDLSEINTKERRATHTRRRGRGCETRRRNISWITNLNFFLCLFIFQTKKDHGGFFFKQAEILTLLTRSWFDKKPEVTELVG